MLISLALLKENQSKYLNCIRKLYPKNMKFIFHLSIDKWVYCFPYKIFRSKSAFTLLSTIFLLFSNQNFAQITGVVSEKKVIKTQSSLKKKQQIKIRDIGNYEQKSVSNILGLIFSNNIDFNFTGALQTFTVPCGVTQIYVTAYGAEGGAGALGGDAASGGVGGKGSVVSGYLSVTPGQILNLYVGGAGATGTGGYNGGGNGGSENGGGGGGATDIRYPGTTVSDRLLVAAGGGGGGRAGCESNVINGGAGGNGDGNGTNGNNSIDGGGGTGGIGLNFGVKGIGCSSFLGENGTTGNVAGIGGNGGNGQNCCCYSYPSIPGGGGGGGGYIGGGGGGGGSAGTIACSGNFKGAGGGGAGGISYMGNIGLGKLLTGIKTGNGKITISYDINASLLNDSLSFVQLNCAVASSFALDPIVSINSSLVSSDSTQLGRLNRNLISSTCATSKTSPGVFTSVGLRHFKTFYFANTSGTSQCFDVEFNTSGVNLFFATYLNKFNPNNIALNYLGDPGNSLPFTKASQVVPAGDTLVIVVHESNVNGGLNAPFQLKLRGIKNLEYSANDGVSWQSSQTFSGLGAGDFTAKVRFSGSSCFSNKLNFQTANSSINITTNYTNNYVNKLSTSSISASNKVFSPSEVYYKAGKSVILNPGFEAANGSLFKASIGGCN